MMVHPAAREMSSPGELARYSLPKGRDAVAIYEASHEHTKARSNASPARGLIAE